MVLDVSRALHIVRGRSAQISCKLHYLAEERWQTNGHATGELPNLTAVQLKNGGSAMNLSCVPSNVASFLVRPP